MSNVILSLIDVPAPKCIAGFNRAAAAYETRQLSLQPRDQGAKEVRHMSYVVGTLTYNSS